MNRWFWLGTVLLAFNSAMWFAFAPKRQLPAPEVNAAARVNTNAPARPKPAPVVVVRTNAFRWEQLEAEDYRTYIERLRRIGCPEQTIRDIVIADLEKLMAPKVREIDGPKEPPKYWKPERKELIPTSQSLAKLEKKQEIDFEKRAIIRELLGVDLAAERLRNQGETDIYTERLGFLDAAKRAQVRMITERANREEIRLREESWLLNDELTPEERTQLREIQARKEREIAAMLGPEEIEQYNLWFSPSAYRVRDSFFTMEPTEEDFLALYKIQREFDLQWQQVDPAELNPEQKRSYELSQREYENRIRDYLGEDRYAQFQRARDEDYQRLHAAAAQFGLGSGAVSEVYGFKQVLAEERSRVAEMKGLSADQRHAVNLELAAEAEKAVVEVMGPKAYRYYLRSGAGEWIYGN